MKNSKFFLTIFLLIIWLVSSFLSLIFWLTDYNDVLKLEQINYQYTTTFKYTTILEEELYGSLVTLTLVISLFTSVFLILCLISKNWVKQELSSVVYELRLILQKNLELWQHLTKAEKSVFLFLLSLVLLIRIYYLFQQTLTTDEVASFDLFVMEGPLAVLSFYPLPNNHILSNFLSLLYFQIQSNPLLVMRVPTILVSLVGTAIIYVVLIRYCGFSIATFSIGVFSLSQMGIFYAIAGRGYFLLLLLAFVNFFSMFSLMYNTGKLKVYWVLFIVTGILGLFTVPTFLYAFASTFFVGLVYFLLKNKTDRIIQLVISSIIISLSSVALYIPLIFISGIDSLVYNKYVQPLECTVFWSGFWYYFSHTEGMLFGQERLGKFVLGAVILFIFYELVYNYKHKIYAKIGLPMLVMTLFPYLFMIVQRVYTPERTLLYKSIYLYVVLGFLLFYMMKKLGVKENYRLGLTSIILIIYSSYQIYYAQKFVVLDQIEEQQRKEAFLWLKPSKPHNIIVPDRFYNLFFNHYFKVNNLNCVIHLDEQPGGKHDFLVLSKRNWDQVRGFENLVKKEVFQNDFVKIYSLTK